DGTMFDVWPTASGILPIFMNKDVAPVGIDYDPDEAKLDFAEELATDRDGPGPLSPGRLKLDDWASQTQKSWVFPTPEEFEKDYGQKAPPDALKLWTRIATAFSQCIFLTFPSSTILASTIPRDALQTLRAKVETLVTGGSDWDPRILGLLQKWL